MRLNWSQRWHEPNIDFEFENKDNNNAIGLIGINADDTNPAIPYKLENHILHVYYKLENVEDTIWSWFNNRHQNNCMGNKKATYKNWKPALFESPKTWKPSELTLRDETRSRKAYFKNELKDAQGTALKIDKIAYPTGVCSTKATDDPSAEKIRTGAGSWPFEYINRVTGTRFCYMTNTTAYSGIPAVNLDIFFDPAAAYKIMVTAQDPINTSYLDYPYS